MHDLDELRRHLATPLGANHDPDQPPIAGHLLWDTLITAGHTPAVHDHSAGRAITLDLPDGTSIWISEQADITHPPAEHEGWCALHFNDPTDPLGDYVMVYMGDGLTHADDTAACVEAITAWIAAHQAVGAIARQAAYVALPKTIPRETLRMTWVIAYSHPGFNGIRPPTPSTQHAATLIHRSWEKPDPTNPDADPTDLWIYLRRGACTGCPWEGPNRRDHNQAIEDALDHTHPTWRQHPALPTGASGKRAAQLAAHRSAIHPARWFDSGGPLKVTTTIRRDRHEPGRAPGGGYLVKVHQPPKLKPGTAQLSLLDQSSDPEDEDY
ncbi:DUF6349 family protein [Kitasatospora sp. NPDC048545]|uniref:DUF6349 family protein n=1 Tax=Kitasatospora sp. NPDC048545 TaxID=3157208 RepID=UPI0033C4DDC1